MNIKMQIDKFIETPKATGRRLQTPTHKLCWQRVELFNGNHKSELNKMLACKWPRVDEHRHKWKQIRAQTRVICNKRLSWPVVRQEKAIMSECWNI